MTSMLVSEYDAFVRSTDQSTKRSQELRLRIATYGLASEVGSVVAAIKKQLLGEGGPEAVGLANTEIVEELGDAVWYLFALAQALSPGKPFDVFAHDIQNLRAEIGGGNARANRIRDLLGSGKHDEFLNSSEGFDQLGAGMVFENYQTIAFLTARTEGRTLVEVCLAVLWQLSAELLRLNLPAFERELNKGVVDREPDRVLGEIAWHIAALASVYGLRLSEVARANVEKIRFRVNRDNTAPLHDEDCREDEQFPRRFEICFVTVSPGRARMYLNGRRLGDDLTDNAYEDDGYRFHDVMHLANIAKLGWSPVVRKLMGRKRKSYAKKDEVEDGARAQIVEEAVIKAIHSEGVRLAGLTEASARKSLVRLFPNRSDITFRFLKLINSFVAGLEVHRNHFWEWEDAIFDGYAIYDSLRREGQGTVTVNLAERSITFRPSVVIEASGRVVGLGSAYLNDSTVAGDAHIGQLVAHARAEVQEPLEALRMSAQKLAILDALGVRQPSADQWEALRITEVPDVGISVKAGGTVQQAMWDRQVVSFRTTVAEVGPDGLYCTAIAMTDD